MNTKPLISIIIPVYNAEKYLTACIDSVLAQTYSNIEVILVNDGSKDSSGKICDTYKYQDTRTKVIHLENGGVSRARNIGINACNGDYLCFIDADDTVVSDCINNFVKSIEYGVQIYIQGIHIIQADNSVNTVLYKKNGIQSINEIFINNNLCSHGYATCKMYNTFFIKNNRIDFPQNIKFCEDLLFILKCLFFTDKIKYIEKAGYNYFLREGNASSKEYSLQTEFKCWKCFYNLIDKLSIKYNIDLIEKKEVGEIYNMLFSRVRNTLYNGNYHKKDRLSIFKSLTRKELYYIHKYSYSSNYIVKLGYYIKRLFGISIMDCYFKTIYKYKKR